MNISSAKSAIFNRVAYFDPESVVLRPSPFLQQLYQENDVVDLVETVENVSILVEKSYFFLESLSSLLAT